MREEVPMGFKALRRGLQAIVALAVGLAFAPSLSEGPPCHVDRGGAPDKRRKVPSAGLRFKALRRRRLPGIAAQLP